MQPLTERMRLRVNSIIALKEAILPGFCEEMKCDSTCWFHSEGVNDRSKCLWLITCRKIDGLAEMVYYDGHGYTEKPGSDDQKITNPDFLEIT